MKNIIFIIIFTLISTITFSQEKKYITYKVTDNETITSIAKKLGVTPFDLLRLNPDAKNGINIDEVIIIPNKNYIETTQVSKSTKASYKDSIVDGILYHRVKFGETIYSLSRKYKIKKKKVLRLNGLKKRNKISLGQVLKFPTKKPNNCPKIVPIPKIKTPKIETVIVQNGYEEQQYATYTVKAQDTKYSLARLHHISVEELEQINPQLKDKTLNEYDVIKLPTDIVTVSTETITTYKTHTVQPLETFYKLTKLYNVTEEILIALNPFLRNGLKEGMILKIPNSSINNNMDEVVEETNYTSYLVQTQETFFSLTRKLNITQEELIALNPKLSEGLKEGMLLKIPTKKEEIESILNLDNNFSGKQLNVVLMLPFKADQKQNASFKDDKTLNLITDFYLGSIIAIDKLKQNGLSVNVKVLDTKGKSPATIKTLVATTNFTYVDAIIGPLYYPNVEQLVKSLPNRDIPIISPIASTDHRVLNAKNVIQVTASDKEQQQKILDFIIENYNNQNLIIVEDKADKDKLNFKTVAIVNYLKQHDSIKKATVLTMEDGYIKKEKFEESIKQDKENWVISVSDNTSKIAIDNLGFLSEEFKVTLFALKKGRALKNVKNTFLNRLNFHYPTSNFVDKNNAEVIMFNQNYQARYGALPTDFSYKGYDTMYDALIRIATYKNLNDAFQNGKTLGINANFNYDEYQHYNKDVFIVKYQDYELVKVK